MANKFVNLSALDWDDSALIRAYNTGMSLRVEDFEEGNSNKKARDSEKKAWKVGDFCQALYPDDGLMYEAKIVSLSDGFCIVEFLGYDEELDVDIDTLTRSKGKKSRKRQIRTAKRTINEDYHVASVDESASGDDTRNIISSPIYSKRKGHRNSHGNHQMSNHSVDYTAAESSFQTVYPTPAHPNAVPPPAMMAPPCPPMPHCSDPSQSSLTSMMTSWYMAGYYTALHQVQKTQRCCCHAPQNCCRH